MEWNEMDPWKFVYGFENDRSTRMYGILRKLVPEDEARALTEN